MAGDCLSSKLQGVGQGLFVRAHETGQLLENCQHCNSQSGLKLEKTFLVPSSTYLDEQLPVFRIHDYGKGVIRGG